MKFVPTLVFFVLSFFSLVSAHNKFQAKHIPRVISSRQHHAPRALLDVCVYLDADVPVPIDVLGILGIGPVHLDVCLCLSALPIYIEGDIHLKAIASILGNDVLSAILAALIDDAPGSKHCTYPPHSQTVCTPTDPCGFKCDPPFVRQGDICACVAPYSKCNGQCSLKGCSSAVPRSLKRRGFSSVLGATTLSEAQHTCNPEEIVCGTYNGKGFDCIDIDIDLESCGGCTIDHPFPSSPSSPKGVDCSRIKGARDVSCDSGVCVVTSCQAPYEPNATRDGCTYSSYSEFIGNSQTHFYKNASLPQRAL